LLTAPDKSVAIRKIVKYPDSLLREVSSEVREPGEVRELVVDMTETMYAGQGAGLAAIQVGVPLRVFIVDAVFAGGSARDLPLVFINPRLTHLGEERETLEEGCLSFPQVFLSIARSLVARIEAVDLDGYPFEREAVGLLARALQHETDHLDGRLIIDHVGRVRRQLVERKLRAARPDDGEEGRA
jgi:peptide deformylase